MGWGRGSEVSLKGKGLGVEAAMGDGSTGEWWVEGWVWGWWVLVSVYEGLVSVE